MPLHYAIVFCCTERHTHNTSASLLCQSPLSPLSLRPLIHYFPSTNTELPSCYILSLSLSLCCPFSFSSISLAVSSDVASYRKLASPSVPALIKKDFVCVCLTCVKRGREGRERRRNSAPLVFTLLSVSLPHGFHAIIPQLQIRVQPVSTRSSLRTCDPREHGIMRPFPHNWNIGKPAIAATARLSLSGHDCDSKFLYQIPDSNHLSSYH